MQSKLTTNSTQSGVTCTGDQRRKKFEPFTGCSFLCVPSFWWNHDDIIIYPPQTFVWLSLLRLFYHIQRQPPLLPYT